jgi:hypothetical protein
MQERGTTRARGGRRVVRVTATAVVLVCGLIATGCFTPVPEVDDFSIVAAIQDGSIDIAWTPQPGAGAGYEVEVRSQTGPWTFLGNVAGPSATFADPIAPTVYWFRVRTAAGADAAAGEWSAQRSALYVEPTLPIVRIDTDGRAPVLDKDNYVSATMTLDPNGSEVEAYSGTLGIRGRGNTTWLQDKKPYRLKLDVKDDLMGMASHKDWALLANAMDQSHLRTFAAAQLAGATDLAWTPGYRHVEVILNGEYLGVYQLAEHVKVGGSRIDIDEMDEGDVAGEALTGGYLLEIDARLEENSEPGFRTPRSVPIVIKDPEPATSEQFDYVRQFVSGFEDALYSPMFTDAVTGYRSYLDVGSFIDWYLVHELARNQDAMWSSTYIHKPRGGLLTFGPMWDFDLSIGTDRAIEPSTALGWHVRRPGTPWVPRLFEDPAFAQQVVARWDQLRATWAELPDEIEALGAQLAPAVDHDQMRWNYVVGPPHRPSDVADWLRTRLHWIDTQFHPGG